MKKMRIGIDLDGVVFMTLHRVLEKYNAIRGSKYTVDDVKTWDSHHWLDGDLLVYDLFRDPRIYRDLPVFPGAREILFELDQKHDVFLVTDTPAQCLPERMKQLEELFPPEEFRFTRERQMFVGKHKEHIVLDVLLDDKPENIERFQEAGYGIPVVFDWTLNRHLHGYLRVGNWKEFGELMARLEQEPDHPEKCREDKS